MSKLDKGLLVMAAAWIFVLGFAFVAEFWT